MNVIQRSAAKLAQASEGSPMVSTVVVILFFLMFNFVEAGVEIAAFGCSFRHSLDAVFAAAFMAYAAYAVHWCALFNSAKASAKTEW